MIEIYANDEPYARVCLKLLLPVMKKVKFLGNVNLVVETKIKYYAPFTRIQIPFENDKPMM